MTNAGRLRQKKERRFNPWLLLFALVCGLGLDASPAFSEARSPEEMAERRERIRERRRRFRELSPERQELLRKRFEKFRQLPPEERAARIEKWKARRARRLEKREERRENRRRERRNRE